MRPYHNNNTHNKQQQQQDIELTWQLARHLEVVNTMGDSIDPFRREKEEIKAIAADTAEASDVKMLKVWALNSHLTTYSVLDGNKGLGL